MQTENFVHIPEDTFLCIPLVILTHNNSQFHQPDDAIATTLTYQDH